MTLDAIIASPYFGIIIGGLCAYFGSQKATGERLTRIEEAHKALKERFDSDHMKLDDHLQKDH